MNAPSTAPMWGVSSADLILMALLQSRLQERARQLKLRIATELARVPPVAARCAANDDDALGQAQRELQAVQEASWRINHGQYGRCAVCGAPISWDNLLEAPHRTTCPTCSTAAHAASAAPSHEPRVSDRPGHALRHLAAAQRFPCEMPLCA
jgi:hypothetical protein